ncbi:hypothetical protein BDZ94DRAFT_1140518, partial [Collybia nuda]
VEDAIDRFPPHADAPQTVDALTSLKTKLKLIDGWRNTYPAKVKYSFRVGQTTTESRLDRIYIKEELIRYSHTWEIRQTGISSDHKLVSMRLIDPRIPYLGKGRFAIPNSLLNHKPLIKKIDEIGCSYHLKLEALETTERNDVNNAQTAHKNFKDTIVHCIREYAKTVMPKIQNKINSLEKDLENIRDNAEADKESNRITAALIDE